MTDSNDQPRPAASGTAREQSDGRQRQARQQTGTPSRRTRIRGGRGTHSIGPVLDFFHIFKRAVWWILVIYLLFDGRGATP
jgi:hypothetical protein